MIHIQGRDSGRKAENKQRKISSGESFLIFFGHGFLGVFGPRFPDSFPNFQKKKLAQGFQICLAPDS